MSDKRDLPGPIKTILKVAGKAWDELAPAAGHGAAEVMSAAYTGNAFVVYGHADPQASQATEQPLHGLPQAEQQVEQQQQQGMGY